MENRVNKIRSKSYEKVIEVNLPMRFYWGKDGYEGFEMDIDSCNSYQRKLLYDVVDRLCYECNAVAFLEFMNDTHREELIHILDEYSKEDLEDNKQEIPKVFLDAFGEKNEK